MEAIQKEDEIVAHRCSANGRIWPYPAFLCSMCISCPDSEDMTARELVDLVNNLEIPIKRLAKDYVSQFKGKNDGS